MELCIDTDAFEVFLAYPRHDGQQEVEQFAEHCNLFSHLFCMPNSIQEN